MNQLILITVLIIAQILAIIARTVNVKYIADNNVVAAVFMSFVINSLWLFTAATGIKSVLDGNYTIMIMYVLGSMLGAYIGMIIKK